MKFLRDIHKESSGKYSWMRSGSSLLLVTLCIGLLTGDVEWGSNFVLVVGIIFGAKGSQKYVEGQMTKMAQP